MKLGDMLLCWELVYFKLKNGTEQASVAVSSAGSKVTETSENTEEKDFSLHENQKVPAVNFFKIQQNKKDCVLYSYINYK